jgi:hypothetical protein
MTVLVSQKFLNGSWVLASKFKYVYVDSVQYFKDLFTVQEALTTTLCVDLCMYILGSDGCLYRGKPKWNEV